MAELIVQYGTWIHRVQLKSAIILGRGEDCDVRIPDTRLSRRHCKIWPAENGAWLVEDLGSRAGTSVDGVAIHQPTPLQAGARMKIGATLVSFELPGAIPLSQSLSGAGRVPQSLFNCDATKVRLLLDTVGALYGSTDLETLLRVVVDRAILVAGGDRGALLLASPGGNLEVGVGRDALGADLPPDEALTRSLPGRVLVSGRAIVLTDTEAAGQQEQTPESVQYGGLKSVLCVPLPGSEKPVGVLYVDAYRPVENFGAEDLAIFEALAVQAALAIERARLREQQVRRERDHRQRLEAENAALRSGIEPVAPIGFTHEAVEALQAHAWPGNAREPEHRVQRAVLLANPPFVTRRDLGLSDERIQTAGALPEAELPIMPLPEARAEAITRFERAYLEEVLQRSDGNLPRAAILAGVSPQLLRRLVQRHGIDLKRFLA